MGGPGPIQVVGTILYRNPASGGFLYGIALDADPAIARHIREFLGG